MIMQNVKLTAEEYAALAKKSSPRSHLTKDCLRAFLFGGMICAIGEGVGKCLLNMGIEKETGALLTSVILIFAAALLTGLGLYEKLGKCAGAGSIVPITGFANSVAAPAIEFKKEGFVFGVGAKMFAVAGPVIVYGTLTSVIVGIIYFVTR